MTLEEGLKEARQQVMGHLRTEGGDEVRNMAKARSYRTMRVLVKVQGFTVSKKGRHWRVKVEE